MVSFLKESEVANDRVQLSFSSTDVLLTKMYYSKSFCVQLNPDNSNWQRKYKLILVIGVSSYRAFKENT